MANEKVNLLDPAAVTKGESLGLVARSDAIIGRAEP